MTYVSADIVIIPGPKAILIVLAVVVGSAFFLFKMLANLPAYIASKRRAAGLSMFQIIIASTQGIDANVLVDTLAIASENGLDIPVDKAKVFYLTGIDIVSVAEAMVRASRVGLRLTFTDLAEAALRGEDLNQMIEWHRGRK